MGHDHVTTCTWSTKLTSIVSDFATPTVMSLVQLPMRKKNHILRSSRIIVSPLQLLGRSARPFNHCPLELCLQLRLAHNSPQAQLCQTGYRHCTCSLLASALEGRDSDLHVFLIRDPPISVAIPDFFHFFTIKKTASPLLPRHQLRFLRNQ